MRQILIPILMIGFGGMALGQPAQQVSLPGGDTVRVNHLIRQSILAQPEHPDGALQSAQKAMELSEKIHFLSGFGAASMEAGNICLLKKDYVNALRYYEKAQPVLLQAKDHFRLGRLLKKIGDLYSARSYFRQSADHYRNAIFYLKKTGQADQVAECWEKLAGIQASFGFSARAIGHYRKALRIKTQLGDTDGTLFCNTMLSKLYFAVKNYDSSLWFNQEVLRQAGADWATETDAAIDEVVILTFLGRTNAAEISRQKAEKLVAQQNNPSNKIKLLSAVSNLYLAQKDKMNADKYLDSAKTLLSGSQNPELAISGLSQMAEISKNNGDYKAAFEALSMMDHYKDIFRSENMERISAEISKAAEVVLQEKEIQYLNLENKLQETELSQEKLKRLALLRENILKDSSITNQKLLLEAIGNEARLREEQLIREQELSRSLSRENELKQKLLNDERKNKKMLWTGLGILALLGGIIFYQYGKQRVKSRIIKKQSEELAVLNKEIHHRVKNNLQVISSMLDLQSQSLKDKKAVAIMKDGIQRVRSMAFIHQNLCHDNSANSVDMDEYVKVLSNHLFQSYNIHPQKIQLHAAIENLHLHTDTAIPLGMILNELVSNSLKYAFKNRGKGDIWIAVKKIKNKILLQVRDNGDGLPEGFDPGNTTTFGFELIHAFVQKLKGQIQIRGNNGTDVQIYISKFKTTV